ncbi:MAG TPA: hypothetical protein GXX51_07660 [Firmicutes bacterium]|nr:hypothetical protein [Bacillota bacterium]
MSCRRGGKQVATFTAQGGKILTTIIDGSQLGGKKVTRIDVEVINNLPSHRAKWQDTFQCSKQVVTNLPAWRAEW